MEATGKARPLSVVLEAAGPFEPDAITRREARARAHAFYRDNGRKQAPAHLLSQTGKLAHSEGFAVGLQLRPGGRQCMWATKGCTAACVLETSFRGKSATVRNGRDMRTAFLEADPQAMVTLIAWELRDLVAKHGAVAFRPNIASDLRWEFIAPALFGIAGVRGYDYTKANPLKHRGRLDNYRLTYSVSEHALSEAIGAAYVKAGGTAAVVVRTPKHSVPNTWRGMPAIDGDLTDDRTTDPTGVYVLLASKADGKADRTGFVKPLEVVAA